MVTRQDQQIRFYNFLRKRAETQDSFTIEDIMKATAWAQSTARTYVAKQVKDLIKRTDTGLRVRRELLRISMADFLALVTQKERILPKYERTLYENLVTYEFLLPLTKEDTLRRTLDELFYRDTLEQRLHQIEPKTLEEALMRLESEGDDDYISRVAEVVSHLFNGYSITHVNGRFLAAPLASRNEVIGQRYIIDETTAIVRFIIPCRCSELTRGEVFEATYQAEINEDELGREIATIRILFLNTFVEAVVQDVLEEDEIWVLETAASSSRLYIWRKAE